MGGIGLLNRSGRIGGVVWMIERMAGSSNVYMESIKNRHRGSKSDTRIHWFHIYKLPLSISIRAFKMRMTFVSNLWIMVLFSIPMFYLETFYLEEHSHWASST